MTPFAVMVELSVEHSSYNMQFCNVDDGDGVMTTAGHVRTVWRVVQLAV